MMLKKIISLIYFLILIPTPQIFSQLSHQNLSKLDNIAIEEFNEEDVAEAIKLLQQSISISDNPESYFKLAKIYTEQNTVKSRAKARKLIQKAIWKEPKNIEYRLLQAKLMQSFGRNFAFKFYEDIINLDSSCTDALINLGRIEEEEYYEYINSVLQVEDDPPLCYDSFAIEDFIKAEKFYNIAIKSDSSCIYAYTHLANMYQDIGKTEIGITYLKKAINIDSDNKDALLLLGYFYYKTSKLDSSFFAYKTAFGLMNEDELNELKYKSALLLVENKLNKKLKDLPETEIEKSLNNFWNVSDPLFMTDYNERLLEHYSRVIYSNQKFSVDKLGISGWNSDRGETVIRYGEPVYRIRHRPYINAGGRTQLMLKTDFWYYKDKVLGFVDESWNENYRFSTPMPGSRHISQFPGDADFFMNDLRRTEPESYEPKFEGPVIQVPFNIAQFKNPGKDSSSATQVYINYALNSDKLATPGNPYPLAHKYGIFFVKQDSEIETVQKKHLADLDYKRDLKLGLFEKYKINSVLVDLPPDSGVLAFEIIRDTDNGVFTNRTNFKIKKFDSKNLDMSDIILASNVDESNILAINRENLSLLPNPLNTFSATNQIFIYFEVYNLSEDDSGLSNFEQRITITKIKERSGIGDFFNSFLSVIGMGEEKNTLTLTTDYQSYINDTPVYLQLDMSKYEKGNYKINIEIEDLKNGSVVNSQTTMKWQ